MDALSGKVKVSPKEISDASDLATRRIGEYRKALDQMQALLSGSSSFWEGPGGEAFRTAFGEEYRSVEAGLSELEQYPAELRRLAGIYPPTVAKAEQTVDDINSFTMI